MGPAMTMFEELELWDNLVVCYRLLDKQAAAKEHDEGRSPHASQTRGLVRRQLGSKQPLTREIVFCSPAAKLSAPFAFLHHAHIMQPLPSVRILCA